MLRGERVNLRLVREQDLDELFDLWQDVRARGPYYPLGMRSFVAQRAEFQETGFWRDDMGSMIVEDKENVIQGQVSCFKPAVYFRALELAYIILRPQSRGQGYMTEAVRLFVNYLFDIHRINRIQLTTIVGNQGSRRVAEKCGFYSEGILRQAVFQKGRFVDIEMFALLRDERPGVS